jgi:hypothetical protein
VRKVFNNIQLLPLYGVLAYTMGLPGFTKLFNHQSVIEKYETMFKDTFIEQMVGTSSMIYVLGFLEFLVVGLLIISLVKKEFLYGKSKDWLLAALFMTMSTFAALGFGLRLISSHAGAANLFYYFMFTFFTFIWIARFESINFLSNE